MQNISNAAMLAEATLVNSRVDANERIFALDTTFVLFFLALDFGQAWLTFGIDGILATVTFAAFVVVPYLLPFSGERPAFSGWILGRILVAAAGISFGLMLRQSIGILLPEAFRFVPMTLLIVAAIICCYVQIYGILKNRLAR